MEPEIPIDDFLAKKLSIFSPLSTEEYAALTRLQRRERHVDAKTELLTQGEPIAFAYVLKDGWAIRSKLLDDGRRQIVSFVLPGDIVGAVGAFVHTAEQTVETLTEATVAEFKPQRLLTLYRRLPRLGAALSWSAAREESMLAERIVSLGRRSAYEALAHLFLELSQRLQAVGLAGRKTFELPMTQTDLADALGLTVVHVNRTLKKLQKDGLLRVERGVVTLLDIRSLSNGPAFRDRYLRHRRVPKETETLLQEGID